MKGQRPSSLLRGRRAPAGIREQERQHRHPSEIYPAPSHSEVTLTAVVALRALPEVEMLEDMQDKAKSELNGLRQREVRWA